MTTMKGKVKYLSLLVLLLVAGLPGWASARGAVLYELVENVGLANGHRIAWAALSGTAGPDTPFCPLSLLDALGLPHTTTCTVTASGGTDIDTSTGGGTVFADIAVVVNADNFVDAPEAVVLTGRIDGMVQAVPLGTPGITPDFSKKKTALGPSVPIILLFGGTFTQVKLFGMFDLPDAGFSATFRLPFKVGTAGPPEKPERGKNAYYLGDGGKLIKVTKDETLFSFPMVRVEVTFD